MGPEITLSVLYAKMPAVRDPLAIQIQIHLPLWAPTLVSSSFNKEVCRT